jgi:hypothetical protein
MIDNPMFAYLVMIGVVVLIGSVILWGLLP